MIPSASLVVVLLLPLVSVSDKGKGWQEFVSREGRFKVLMPARPKERKQTTSGVQMTMYAWQQKSGGYMAGYADLPIPANETEEMTQTRLDGAAKGAAANVRGKMLKQTRVQLAKKYPGREIRVELPNQRGFMQSRLYLVNGRMYMVMVVGTKGWVDSSDTKKFLDSFALTG